MDSDSTLLEIQDLHVHFAMDEGIVRAVNGVSLHVERGKTLGIVGESGCGKSVMAKAIMNIVPPPGHIVSGKVIFRREQEATREETIVLTDLDPTGTEIRAVRGKDIAMVFQEPMSSFSPVHTIGNQIVEAIMLHNPVGRREAHQRAIEILELVGMPQASLNVDRYPHQLSGGMCQRAMIGMALVCRPSLLIADEPTTALDVTTEAQILDLIRTLQAQMGMAILYITHNLGVIAQLADDVCVMYKGRIVERASVDAIFYEPKHPYTKALLRSIPRIGRKAGRRLASIEGNVPSPFVIPSGCAFHPRCEAVIEGVCNVQTPHLTDFGSGHTVSCHLHGERESA
jgi:oligopeptide/dipeptide ABC transporter ATP-binding protein